MVGRPRCHVAGAAGAAAAALHAIVHTLLMLLQAPVRAAATARLGGYMTVDGLAEMALDGVNVPSHLRFISVGAISMLGETPTTLMRRAMASAGLHKRAPSCAAPPSAVPVWEPRSLSGAVNNVFTAR